MKKNPNVIVRVRPSYVQVQSDPEHAKFVWAYEINIANNSEEILQLLNRYWRITDMTGKVEEIHGAGVVGLQPLIKPAKDFTYKSFCQLATPQGTMEGHFEMQNLEEEHCLVVVPKFILSAPAAITKGFRSKLH